MNAIRTWRRAFLGAAVAAQLYFFTAVTGDCVRAQSIDRIALEHRDVITGMHVPWEILWGPDNWLWVTERNGYISRVHPETGERHYLLEKMPEVLETNESGLLGMALHPEFGSMPYVYVIHTGWRDTDSVAVMKIARYTYLSTGNPEDDTLVDRQVIWSDCWGKSQHDGARLLIDDSLMLWVSTGDQQNAWQGQDLKSYNGKILRMTLEGKVPESNPFPESYVWSYGHRNPQGLTFGPHGMLFASEHGTWFSDEVNIIQKGRNHGWPLVEGPCDERSLWDTTKMEQEICDTLKIVEPIFSWTPTVAPAALKFYEYDAIPEFQNCLLQATLRASKLVQLQLDETSTHIVDTANYLDFQLGRLRAICISNTGRIFIGTSNFDGKGLPDFKEEKIVELYKPTKGVFPVGPRTPRNAAIFPNPVDRRARIVPESRDVSARCVVVDGLGRTVREIEILPNSEAIFTRGDLASGIYHVQLWQKGDVMTLPMILE